MLSELATSFDTWHSQIDLWTELNEVLKINEDRDLPLVSRRHVLVLRELHAAISQDTSRSHRIGIAQSNHISFGLTPLIIREVKDPAKLDAGDSEIIHQY